MSNTQPIRHRYLPMTPADQEEMLGTIGADSIEDLFADIPKDVRFQGTLPVSSALDEAALLRHLKILAGRNADSERYVSFLGAGIYDHHIPVVIGHMLSRSEFYTAYTPYQAEISQGELQAIFEFQSYICELTGMAVANASMYDGATALAEAGALACGAVQRRRLAVSQGVHPEAREILRTTARGLGLEVVEVPCRDGVTDLEALRAAVTPETAAVLVQSPNFFGCVENLRAIEPAAHTHGGLLAVSVNPLSLGLLEAPGRLGADIVTGDAQPLGLSASLGGPTCGFFAVTSALMRRMPGRIVGQTTDREGRRGFVLTLQTREQHIRRERATSNICSNQALLALGASVYLSLMGREGIAETARLNLHKAHYAAGVLSRIPGVSLAYGSPFFNEFTLRLPEETDVPALRRSLLQDGYLAGHDLGSADPALQGLLLIAVTERRTREEIDAFARRLEAYL
ncbi:aminomethyl-transferring glycine dehydrogenase subunit GcvPA [Paenibacillus mucilaginosus]|uniref:Probable glycine dehydrogenase (decarboxylating) subunit 1 n=3 Tax=Paenibacillus mucilaginosus TaxID=61624 RepID=H6NRB4_9BACL|nr:aminomethyl-transferring glycine dehydrogenase subunit GcvPA [Paenibacillus mucilaginosus]AEI45906.1 GcvPA [Paenibacillus mucilaginosus KNP414]AFC33549.1 GcvPA [Paenibacillus mucilaginosus 3016]AFH65873.1 glycine dehydrogenase subunit 1 [Paenibacillus mucilaginosus K02]WFA21952.1 aminomethyl-transferring glycine dehydrogenase subunit GcvPA [Paenibacillus mucilaginosus]